MYFSLDTNKRVIRFAIKFWGINRYDESWSTWDR